MGKSFPDFHQKIAILLLGITGVLLSNGKEEIMHPSIKYVSDSYYKRLSCMVMGGRSKNAFGYSKMAPEVFNCALNLVKVYY
jgi:hypothetical protein